MADKNDIVIINLDRPRMLWYGHKALKTMFALTGKSFTDLNLEEMNFEDIEKILYCGLLTDAKRNNEVLKLDEIEDLLDLAPFGELVEKMQESLSASFGNMANEKN